MLAGLRQTRTASPSALPKAPRGSSAALLVVLFATLACAQLSMAASLDVTLNPGRGYAAPGGQLTFSSEVTDAAGRPVDAVLTWQVIPPRLGTVSDAGLFRAGDAEGRGIVRIVAVAGEARGTAHAIVEVGNEPSGKLLVEIEPRRATLEPGAEEKFIARVTDPFDGSLVDARIEWAVLPSHVGTIDANGLFVAGVVEGAGRVIARASHNGMDGLGDAEVVVGAQHTADVAISVTPAQVSLGTGEEIQFTAEVLDGAGSPVAADVRWSVVPTRLGIVTADGRFTAGGQETAGRVVASVVTERGFSRGFSSLEVSGPGVGRTRVLVRPRDVVVTRGDNVQFEAQVRAPDGGIMDLPVTWRVRPEWIGDVTPDGFFTASEEFREESVGGKWTGSVIASLETSSGVIADAATVVIREAAGQLKLRVRPRRAVVAPGEHVQFEAEVIGAGGPADWSLEWAIFPENLGTITPDGLFTPHATLADPASGEFGPREGVVRARAVLQDGTVLVDLAHVAIRMPGQPVRIHVRPAYAVIEPGGTRGFRAVILGSNGQSIELPVEWSVVPPELGTIGPDGVFEAASHIVDPSEVTKPRGKIVAEVRTAGNRVFRGFAVVVIDLPNPDILVRVSPKERTMAPGQSFQFVGEVFDRQGGLLDLPLMWRVTNPDVGTVDQNGMFTASDLLAHGQQRTTKLAAGLEYEGRLYWDTATIRVRAAP